MRSLRYPALMVFSLLLIGCAGSNEKPAGQNKKPGVPAAAIEANLAKLGEDDRAAAQTQKFCAVHGDNLLGSMGVPVKIVLKNKEGEAVDVFLCCKGCEKAARKDEAKTLAVVEELNIKGNLAKLSPEDRQLAEAQKFCAATPESRLGSMGTPEKYIIKDKDGSDHPVFVCCGGCIKTVKKDEAKALQVVEELKKKNAQAAPK